MVQDMHGQVCLYHKQSFTYCRNRIRKGKLILCLRNVEALTDSS